MRLRAISWFYHVPKAEAKKMTDTMTKKHMDYVVHTYKNKHKTQFRK